ATNSLTAVQTRLSCRKITITPITVSRMPELNMSMGLLRKFQTSSWKRFTTACSYLIRHTVCALQMVMIRTNEMFLRAGRPRYLLLGETNLRVFTFTVEAWRDYDKSIGNSRVHGRGRVASVWSAIDGSDTAEDRAETSTKWIGR